MIIRGDARHLPIADHSVDCIVTSPPYLCQRVYGSDLEREVGREETLAEYVEMLASVFDECRRVLKPSGWAFLNISDRANNSGGAGGDWGKIADKDPGGPGKFRDPAFAGQSFIDVPGAVLAALLRRGWLLRMPIVWDKGREAPESMRHVKRPRWSHEMIFMLAPGPSKERRFYPSQLVETGSVWHFKPGGNGDSHLAPFPDELVRRCILPTTMPGDVVLDPFCGSGTVPRVARSLGRVGIGVDIYAGRPDLVHGMATVEP